MSAIEVNINKAASQIDVEIGNDAKSMSVQMGSGGGVTFSGSSVKLAEITLLAKDWRGGNPWHQVVNIDGVTAKSLVDLQPSVAQLLIFHQKDLAFTTENDNGVVTVFAVGDKPTNDYTIQATIMEVRA